MARVRWTVNGGLYAQEALTKAMPAKIPSRLARLLRNG
jgi:hypothetical protein